MTSSDADEDEMDELVLSNTDNVAIEDFEFVYDYYVTGLKAVV